MPLTIHGETYDTGIGGHADCTFTLSLDGEATRLTGLVGIDDETAGRGYLYSWGRGMGRGEGGKNLICFASSSYIL